MLRPVLREVLSKRSFMAGGKTCQLSEKALDSPISQICFPALNEGLLKVNERMYNHLLYGIAVTKFIYGKKVNPTIALIDWKNPENNQFQFTEEFTVLRSGGVKTRRPDIVCFVNGIPLTVIEAKRPDGYGNKGPTTDEGISQTLRNQRNDEIPRLFAYSQLLLSINGHDGRYRAVSIMNAAHFAKQMHQEQYSSTGDSWWAKTKTAVKAFLMVLVVNLTFNLFPVHTEKGVDSM